ncbi:MAG: CHASE domain-containing protein [Pseudomonadota bacterium]|nr:CHASE domain-containing protein [Pseudomonadota bacterium]
MNRSGRSIPVLVTALVGGLLSVLAFLAVRQAEDDAIRRAVAEEAGQIVDRVDADFDARSGALVAMARRWQAAGGLSQDAWEDDAAQHAVNLPASFLALERTDAAGIVRWTIPRESNEAAVDQDLTVWEARRQAMENARATGAPAVTVSVDLFQGGKGVLLFVPLYGGGRFDGWLVGVVGVDAFVWEAQRAAPGYRVVITERDRLVVASRGTAFAGFCRDRPLIEGNPAFTLQVCAQRELVEEVRGSAPAVTLLAGLAITALSSGLAGALGVARSHARALERARRELADLSYSVSHEMQTPLRAIDGHAAMLLEDLGEQARAHVARIRANAQRMGQQIDGLIELLRVARYQPSARRVDVSAVARGILASLAESQPDRTVTWKVADGLAVTTGPELLRVILAALLDNAWKFTRGRDPAVIEVGPCPGGFYVRDNGAGFDMAYSRKLYGTFQSLHAPGEFPGLGMGLAIASRAAESLGATLAATSRPGEGATFRVIFGRSAK